MPELHQSKTCPKCNIDRPLDRFYPYHGQCKNCLSVWQGGYYQRKPEKRCGLYTPRLTEDAYGKMFAEQGGCCAVCGSDKPGGKFPRLLIDHCHKSGKVRGLLCHRCNAGLGLFQDHPERLRSAADYLEKCPDVQPEQSRGGRGDSSAY